MCNEILISEDSLTKASNISLTKYLGQSVTCLNYKFICLIFLTCFDDDKGIM